MNFSKFLDLTKVNLPNNDVVSHAYDDNGNRLTHNATTAAYNDQDMMLSYGDNSYTYTANGDLMVKTGVEGTTTHTKKQKYFYFSSFFSRIPFRLIHSRGV